jgi:hypothetical protein
MRWCMLVERLWTIAREDWARLGTYTHVSGCKPAVRAWCAPVHGLEGRAKIGMPLANQTLATYGAMGAIATLNSANCGGVDHRSRGES